MGKCVVLLCLLLACVLTYGYADEFDFYASQDAWVNQANPDANYGANSYLNVKDRSNVAQTFLKFDATDIAKLAGQSISTASLFLYQYQYNYSPGDNLNVHLVTSDWSQDNITWNNRPNYAQDNASSLELTSGNNVWREWKGAEPIVRSWQNGNNFGLMLENNLDAKNEEFLGRFYSSEASDPQLRPHLKITTTTVTPEPLSSLLFVLGGGGLSLISAGLKRFLPH